MLKFERLCEISNQFKKIGSQYSNIIDILPVAEDLDSLSNSVKLQAKAHIQKIESLEKELHALKDSLNLYEKAKSRLIVEKTDLERKLTGIEEKHKEKVRELKCNNKKLQNDLNDLEFIYKNTLQQVKELERDSLQKNRKILQLTKNKTIVLKADQKKRKISPTFPILEISKVLNDHVKVRDKLWASRAQANDVKVINMVEIMEKKCSALSEELRKLKLENKGQADLIDSLRCQVSQRDEEIVNFKRHLQNDNLKVTVDPDYCCHCQKLKCKIGKLEVQLMETIEKQHEAMTRAVHLAERNHILERELKDIDIMAMEVEKEFQNKYKQNERNIKILQEKLSEKTDEIKSLQSEVTDLQIRLDKEKMMVEKLNVEKRAFETSLEDAIAEKKCLNDKINHCIIVERNLRIEISKLQEINRSLQNQLNDIEEKLGSTVGNVFKEKEKLKLKKKNATLGIPSMDSHATNLSHSSIHKEAAIPKNDLQLQNYSKLDHKTILKDRTQKEINFCHVEGPEFSEDIRHNWDLSDLNTNYIKKLKELEKEIEMLKYENMYLRQGKIGNDFVHCSSGDSFKITLDRLERERDLALSDLSKLQTERDILRERIKLTTENQIGENSRMERILFENEERIRRLESERRELISSQGSQRATLSALEEKCDEYKNQLYNLQTELNRITTHYNQLKVLHEETDRSLTEVHGRLSHTQTELNLTLNKLKDLELTNRDLEDQIALLKKEKCTLKSNLACIERQKDELLINLDEKTELCSKHQEELKNRDRHMSELNEKISDQQRKLDIILNEKTAGDHMVLNLERDIEHLREELNKCEEQRETLRRENRRLQDDLTSAIKDCHLARRDLDIEKKEVDNLKRQLQQYVNEVKKAEELLLKKESERNEMLDHFRSLSLEATALESNNHSLESAMENTKVELIAAKSKLMDLEQEVVTKESLVKSYENQIVDLTARVAELETKLKQESEERYRAEEDLTALRDLCSTIDEQRETLKRQANDSDTEKLRLMNEVQRLNDEFEGLNQKLAHERTMAQTLEKSLSHSRKETMEHKISNKDLQTQVQQLRLKIDELTQKLESESQNVQKYQSQCADLSCQVSELRREVTNARFEKARAMENNRRAHSSFACEDINEGRSDEKDCEEVSYRNVPPLMLLEDSDRTVSSFELDECDYEKHFSVSCENGNECHRVMFLSPVMENGSDSKMYSSIEGTSSELSSLPVDSNAYNATRYCPLEGRSDAENDDHSDSSVLRFNSDDLDADADAAGTKSRMTSSECQKASVFQSGKRDVSERGCDGKRFHGFQVSAPICAGFSEDEACLADAELVDQSEVDHLDPNEYSLRSSIDQTTYLCIDYDSNCGNPALSETDHCRRIKHRIDVCSRNSGHFNVQKPL